MQIQWRMYCCTVFCTCRHILWIMTATITQRTITLHIRAYDRYIVCVACHIVVGITISQQIHYPVMKYISLLNIWIVYFTSSKYICLYIYWYIPNSYICFKLTSSSILVSKLLWGSLISQKLERLEVWWSNERLSEICLQVDVSFTQN